MIKGCRGTRDLLPPDIDLWNRVEATVRDVFARYNFHEIRTPIFEDTQLFSRSVGEETDIVSKEMFTWEDKARAQSEKAQSLTLRPRTPPVSCAPTSSTGSTGKARCKASTTSARSSGASARRRDVTASSIRLARRIIGPPSAGSESPCSMPNCWRCWPRCSTKSNSATGICS